MRSLLLVAVYLCIIYLGVQSSFILVLGYIWVDIFTPQLLAYSILPSVPVSLIMGGGVFVALLLLKPDPDIKIRTVTILTITFAIWMSVTLIWSVAPHAAVAKWDWAFKNLVFSCMMPFFFRNRVQVEALIWTIVVSGIAHCLPYAAKFLISGGGYGMQLSLVGNNTGLGESSTLALFSVFLIPLCMYLYKWQTIIPYPKLTRIMLIGFIACALLTSFGTYARTGIVSIAVLGWLLFIKAPRYKLISLTLIAIIGVIAFFNVSDAWMARMSTIGDGKDESAMGRVAVWLWTLEYVMQHPLGGSFEMYRINQHTVLLADGRELEVMGKAFHSIYFEVLGEGGLVGIVIFLAIIFKIRQVLLKFSKIESLDVDRAWLPSLSRFLLISLYVYLAGGAFVGIGFQPFLYYLAAISVIILNMALKLKMVK